MRKSSNAIVKHVYPDSIAKEAGIEEGDIILSVNGETKFDILEYQFITKDDEVELEIKKQNGEIEIVSIYNEDYEDLGIEFENPLIDKARSCSNKCIFCFIDQLPKGMRKTLYFKDDDSRLSFLQGNYVTMTNMSEDAIERIIRIRLSPINISVHTTNLKLRQEMLGNKNAGNIIQIIKKLSQARIQMNCQIVLCRGINDGLELERSILELASFYPQIGSISVVPVGITKYREKLTLLKHYDKKSALEVVEHVQKLQEKLRSKYGSSIVFLADEFYLLSQIDFPNVDHYEEFPQVENGVGLIVSFLNEFIIAYEQIIAKDFLDNKLISIATGKAAAPFIKNLAERLMNKFRGLDIIVYDIENKFFGEHITVAGLLTGQDLIEQLKNKRLGSRLLISDAMLRNESTVLLDDITLQDIERELNIKVSVVKNSGFDFIDRILE